MPSKKSGKTCNKKTAGSKPPAQVLQDLFANCEEVQRQPHVFRPVQARIEQNLADIQARKEIIPVIKLTDIPPSIRNEVDIVLTLAGANV